ncbi:hypothetical protein E2F46_06360 [Luteimonas aestuarii]|uniref:DUF4065 domain-containing protein n=1 Tax=Luteimonas aestuarii TaxID=453837 RepID=A0A4R5TYB5_9GAMM|nr:hypothetical protein [Luteimonas aestuarii]TDK26217.1 hypothetical protein E2F46_06360 [Luteimonas aestuarii]
MTSVPERLQSAILAVLAEAKALNIRLNRTALFKFVYLLDCLHAESHNGSTASEAKWYFHHFGPFAVDLAEGLDALTALGIIQSHDGSFKGKDFTQYWLGEHPIGPTLTDAGLRGSQALRFSQWLRAFAGDMSKLLDHVYFDTLPMSNAVPGQSLDFKELAQEAPVGRRPHTHIKDQGKILRVAQLQEKLKQRFLARPTENLVETIHRPIYDDVYRDAMAMVDDGETIDDPIAFNASI